MLLYLITNTVRSDNAYNEIDSSPDEVAVNANVSMNESGPRISKTKNKARNIH